MEFTIDDFFATLKRIVIASNAEQPCNRINSFIIIGDKFDFENGYPAGKKNNPYFFSRSGGKVTYPTLVLSESRDLLDGYKNDRYSKTCHVFEIGILDQIRENCDNCNDCGKRKEDEIFRNTASLLSNLVTELSVISVWTAQPGDVQVIAPKNLMDAYITSEVYTSYKQDIKSSEILKYNFRNRNPRVDLRKIRLPKTMLMGYFAVLTVCDVCATQDMQYKIREEDKQECC